MTNTTNHLAAEQFAGLKHGDRLTIKPNATAYFFYGDDTIHPSGVRKEDTVCVSYLGNILHFRKADVVGIDASENTAIQSIEEP